MKDHEIREFVNELTVVAKKYGQTQQLREQILAVVNKNEGLKCCDRLHKSFDI